MTSWPKYKENCILNYLYDILLVSPISSWSLKVIIIYNYFLYKMTIQNVQILSISRPNSTQKCNVIYLLLHEGNAWNQNKEVH